MASLGQGTMTIEFSPQARRILERATKALEEMVKTQKQGRVTVHNHPSPSVEIYRDAISGNYVTKEHAEANPGTTVKENVPATRFTRPPLPGEDAFELLKRGANTDAAKRLELDFKDWRTAVGETAGFISACWSNLEGAGTFESTQASEALAALIERLEREIP